MGMEIPGIKNPGVRSDYVVSRQEPTTGSELRSTQNQTVILNQEEINRSLEILRKAFYLFNRKLKFSVNREINRVVVKVIDGTTDKVIKEIPPEKIQKLVSRIKETIGLLFDEKI